MTSEKNAPSLSILHIEDEYREFLSLVGTVKIMIEDYWKNEKNIDTIAKTVKIADCGQNPQQWVVYEIVADVKTSQKFRYIFVRSKELPEAVSDFFLDRRIFILDVLRPVEGSTQLGISVNESLASIDRHVRDPESVVLFTAHQGNGLDQIGVRMPLKISKESDSELEDFISEILVDCLNHD